ncbi:MAG: transporter [Isosphaeraceae bacterium]|nr:transporter [Isosphaeraceae bacterium]
MNSEALGPIAQASRTRDCWPQRRAWLRLHLVVLVSVAITGAAGCRSIPVDGRPTVESQEEADSSSETSEDGARGLFGLPPLRELLSDEAPPPDDDGSAEFPAKQGDVVQPDIRSPGPDIANFPNSAFTLPQGRLYIETSPLFLSGPSQGSAKTYNAEFLIRLGLTDRVELRLFGNGPTFERGQYAGNGFAPLAWDIKTNLWQENRKYHIPAVGFEVFVLTPSGSKSLNQGTQPSVNLLFDHTLPYGFQLEWNVGMVGDPSPNNNFSSIEPAAAWALQREVFKDFDVFIQGYYNGPTLPRFGDGVELGAGAVWALNRRIAIYGSYNGGVSKDAPTTISQLGCAVAF